MSLLNSIQLVSGDNHILAPISSDKTKLWVVNVSILNTVTINVIPFNNPQNFSTISSFPGGQYIFTGISSDGNNVWLIGIQSYSPTIFYLIKISCNNISQISVFQINIPNTITTPYTITTVSSDGQNVWFCISGIDAVQDTPGYPSYVGWVPCSTNTTPSVVNITNTQVNNNAIGSISSDGTYVWVSNILDLESGSSIPGTTITQIQCSDGFVLRTISVVNRLSTAITVPIDISSDGINVWVSLGSNSTAVNNYVTQVSCIDGTIVRYIDVGLEASGISSNGVIVSVICYGSSNVYGINCNTGELSYILDTTTRPRSISSSGDLAWVSDGYNYLYEINTKINPGPNSPILKQDWSSVACSSDGKFVLACVNGGKIYTSSNYGYDMGPDSSSVLPPSAAWSSITISGDGTKAAACVNGGGIYLATLSGTIWFWVKANVPESAWTGISFSGLSSGIAACIDGGSVYFSSNTGASWNSFSSPVHNYTSIGYIGQDASQRFVTSSRDEHIIVYAYVWQTGIPGYNTWNYVSDVILYPYSAISSVISTNDVIFGCIYGGGIYVSSDVGYTWTETSAPTANWSSISSNSNGQYIVACINGGEIYCSIDYGASWQQQVNGITDPLLWTCVATASNSSGSFLVSCAQNDYIYISPYFQGFQWKSNQTYSVNWDCVASDSTGQHVIAGMYWNNGSDTNSGDIYISNDYGISWISVAATNPSLKSQNWISVASNSDGTVLGAVISLSSAYISTNSGQTWVQQSFDTTPNCIRISIDSSGDWGVITSYYYTNDTGNGYIYFSNTIKSNNLWNTIDNPSTFGTTYLYNWTAAKISSDSTTIYACYRAVDPNSLIPIECGIYKATYSSQNNTFNWVERIFYNNSQTYYFNNITCSSDGTHIAVVSPSENNVPSQVWISNDSGANFNNPIIVVNPTTEANYGYQDITMDTTGQKIAIVYYDLPPNTGYIYISLDYGVTWINQTQGLPTTQNAWKSIASNDNMDKLITCAYGGAGGYGGSKGIFTAFLSESSWTPQVNGLPTFNSFGKLSSSSSGQYLAVVANNTTSLTTANYGGIWISKDYGISWTKSNASNLNWSCIASDNTGQYLVAGVSEGKIYTSSTYGLYWTIQSSSSGLPASANWDAISFSCNSDPNSTSQIVYAQNYGGYVYFSTNRGITWKATTGGGPWSNGMGSSSDGTYAYYGMNNTSGPGPFGIWKTIDINGNPNQPFTPLSAIPGVYPNPGNWNYVATDSSGQYVALVNLDLSSGTTSIPSNEYGIYLSTTYGANFFLLAIQAQNWRSISVVKINNTTIGDYLLITAVCENGLIYVCNYLIFQNNWTWTLISATTSGGGLPSSYWSDIKLSSDGTRWVICSLNGGVWTSADSGLTWSQSTMKQEQTDLFTTTGYPNIFYNENTYFIEFTNPSITDYSITINPSADNCVVSYIGVGGGGGGGVGSLYAVGSTSSTAGGGGGASGNIITGVLPYSSGSSIPISIGQGGVGGPGLATTINTSTPIVVNGGARGGNGNASGIEASGGAGGVNNYFGNGGVGAYSYSNNYTLIYGDNAHDATNYNSTYQNVSFYGYNLGTFGGGGGGGASNPFISSSAQGSGGNGGSDSAAAVSGQNGGGGGGGNGSNLNSDGAAGGNGYVCIVISTTVANYIVNDVGDLTKIFYPLIVGETAQTTPTGYLYNSGTQQQPNYQDLITLFAAYPGSSPASITNYTSTLYAGKDLNNIFKNIITNVNYTITNNNNIDYSFKQTTNYNFFTFSLIDSNYNGSCDIEINTTNTVTMYVVLVGGGGGGGGGTYFKVGRDVNKSAGGGGGGGAIATFNFSSIGSNTYKITVGKGGSYGAGNISGSPDPQYPGTTGNTSFGNLDKIVIAGQGIGGMAYYYGGAAGGQGGTVTSNGFSVISYSGATGGNGVRDSQTASNGSDISPYIPIQTPNGDIYYSGGGGGGGVSEADIPGTGGGKAGFNGKGGDCNASLFQNGQNALTVGAGGGGAAQPIFSTNNKGGYGQQGICLLWWQI